VSGSDALFERDREVELLDRLVLGALDGDAVLALVEGPAGIGKSRLLAEARDLAVAAGYRVLAARGSDLEQELP
jgi:predicted ATPase